MAYVTKLESWKKVELQRTLNGRPVAVLCGRAIWLLLIGEVVWIATLKLEHRYAVFQLRFGIQLPFNCSLGEHAIRVSV